MGKRGRIFVILSLIIFSLIFASASFEKANPAYSLTKRIYAPQDFIEGWIKLKFTNEPGDSLLESNYGGSVKLLDFLGKTNSTFTCSPVDCKEDYIINENSNSTSKTFNLVGENSTIVGIKFSGNIVRINLINFTIQSNAPTSCNNQLKIDFLDDETIEKLNDKVSAESCGTKEYGCFDSAKVTDNLKLGTTPYCQKLNLTEAAGYNLGAWVKGSGGKVFMQLYKGDGNRIDSAKCELSGITTAGSEVSCSINYSTTGAEFYACISAESGDYYIQENTNPTNLCGFYGTPVREKTAAYDIFAEKRKFDTIGELKISNNLPDGKKLSEMAFDYIKKRYGSLNCSNTCVVPIRISSYSNQAVTISGLILDYERTSGNVIDKYFYDITEISPKISSDFQQLQLIKAEFGFDEGYGNKTIRIKLNNEEIFSDEVTIKKISTINSIYPTTTAAAVPTEFIANLTLENNSDIAEYRWEFGDGENLTTLKNKATHAYGNISDYKLKVKITDEKGFSSYTIFDISVGSPKNIANITIRNKESNILELKNQIGNFSLFYQQTINKIMNLTRLEEDLQTLKTNYNNATAEEDYINVMKGLINLKIPEFLFSSKTLEESPFLQRSEDIDINALGKITGEEVDSAKENEYINAINGWFVDNLEVNIIYDEISGEYGEVYEPIFNVFTFKVNKGTYNDKYYIIIKKSGNITFKENYGQKESGEYAYIETNSDKEITFSTTESIDFTNIPIFISPSISKLVLTGGGDAVCNFNDLCESSRGENWKNCKDCSKTNIILISIGGIILLGIIVYIILYYWYKKRYEDHLFKSKNSLYNVVNYINNAKAKEIKEEDIRNSLKKVGWNSEQITYAFKKYHGKWTGMFGFSSSKK